MSGYVGTLSLSNPHLGVLGTLIASAAPRAEFGHFWRLVGGSAAALGGENQAVTPRRLPSFQASPSHWPRAAAPQAQLGFVLGPGWLDRRAALTSAIVPDCHILPPIMALPRHVFTLSFLNLACHSLQIVQHLAKRGSRSAPDLHPALTSCLWTANASTVRSADSLLRITAHHHRRSSSRSRTSRSPPSSMALLSLYRYCCPRLGSFWGLFPLPSISQ
jgi:hypothetical protein